MIQTSVSGSFEISAALYLYKIDMPKIPRKKNTFHSVIRAKFDNDNKENNLKMMILFLIN